MDNKAKGVRIPKQERSIEKKNKIISAGYELFSEVGYYKTNTAEIAKRAGVSTGIVYGYFRDKKDILVEVIDIYMAKVLAPLFDTFNELPTPLDFHSIIPRVIEFAVDTHKSNAEIHEALHAMTSSDKEVNEKFLSLEDNMAETIAKSLEKAGYTGNSLPEKVHIAINLVQSFAHEYIYDKHPYIDYDNMRALLIDMLVGLFTK